MRILSINKANPSSKGYVIEPKDNKHIKYLYNKVQDSIKGQGVTTVFARDYIKMDRLTDALKRKLEALKIIFKETK